MTRNLELCVYQTVCFYALKWECKPLTYSYETTVFLGIVKAVLHRSEARMPTLESQEIS